MGVQASAADPTRRSLATPRQRLAAWLLDSVIAALVLAPFVVWLVTTPPGFGRFVAGIAVTLGTLLVWAACDGSQRGATPGKRVLALRVVDVESMGPIGLRRGALRRLAYVIGGLAIGAGWLWLLVDRRKQAFHDKPARTVVIDAR